ncbi:MAG: hypothetical protein LBC71_06130 [Oscillospiraceae bacterium]|jgi:hypothetical protein|nr:hypothetical protein [Oscillospiraceae bacterium]
MKPRKTIAILMFVMILCSPYTLAFKSVYSTPIAIQPYWANVHSVTVGLSFTGTTANCAARVQGHVGTTKIVADVILELWVGTNSYITIKTWNNIIVYGSTLTFSGVHNVARGFTYRLTINADVTRNGTTESVSNWIVRGV